MSQIQKALRTCAGTTITPTTPHWHDDARRLMLQAAGALDAAEEAMAQAPAPARPAWVWNPARTAWEAVHVPGHYQEGALYAFGPLPEPLVQAPAVGAVELVAVIGEASGGVADGEEVIKQRLADALCAVVDRSGLKRKEVAQMLGVSEANLSIKLSGDTNLTIMSVANICGAVGANLSFRVEARDA